MKFEITGTVKLIGEVESFGVKGFQKRNMVVTEINGQYENDFCIEFSGDKLDTPNFSQVGQQVQVSGFINCREWEGRYFTSLKGSHVNNVGQQQPVQQQTPIPAPQQAYAQPVQQQQYQQQPAQQQPVQQQPVQQQFAQPQQQPMTQQAPPVVQQPMQQQQPVQQQQTDIPF